MYILRLYILDLRLYANTPINRGVFSIMPILANLSALPVFIHTIYIVLCVPLLVSQNLREMCLSYPQPSRLFDI